MVVVLVVGGLCRMLWLLRGPGVGQEPQSKSESLQYKNPVAMKGKTKPKVSKPMTIMAVIPPGLIAAWKGQEVNFTSFQTTVVLA